ncbi:MAG TPA: TetR family transcriptional regulator [Porticoccaceae bacterium]|nr:TetR family transcriptional regulator [Porticoccaceae bacterium]HBD12460.1 TetR family transcriptional regulator [Porticoccaceae bacterium]
MNKSTRSRWGKAIQSKAVQHELKRLAILKTAARLFNQNGFRQTSLNDLAEELQVTKPTLYYYIDNKEDILFQCLLTAITRLLEQIEEIQRTGESGLDKVSRFIHVFTNVFDDEFGRCLSQPGPEPLSEKYLSQIEPFYIQLDATMRQMIEDGITDGSIRACDSKIAAFTIFGAINWMTRWYQIGGGMTTREVGNEMANMFTKGLTSDVRKD